MPTVTFVPLGFAAEARAGETVLDAARRTGAPLAASCGSIGICARCRIRPVGHPEALTPPTSMEARTAGERDFAGGERLGCQAVVLGDCTVTTTYWG